MTVSEKMSLALLVSIPLALLTSSEVLSCAHRADVSLIGEIPTCSSERLCLFDQNFLKAVGRAEMEGSCKMYAGKTN